MLLYSLETALIQPTTLKTLIEKHQTTNASATLLTATLDDAGSYGRIIRDDQNNIIAIQEAKDCTPEQRTIGEFNSGIYWL